MQHLFKTEQGINVDIATKDYVDEKIIEASIGEISLSNYYTKNEINELTVTQENAEQLIDDKVMQMANENIYGWNIVYGTDANNINSNGFTVYFNLHGENKSQKWLYEHRYCYRIDGWGHKGLMYGFDDIGPGDADNGKIKYFDYNDTSTGIPLKKLAKNEDISKFSVVRLQLKLNQTNPAYPAACVQFFHNPQTKYLWLGILPSENISKVGTLYFHNGFNDIKIEDIKNFRLQFDGFNKYDENSEHGFIKENSTQYYINLSDLSDSDRSKTNITLGDLSCWQNIQDYDIIRIQLKNGQMGICETFYHNTNPHHVSKHYVDNLVASYEERISTLEQQIQQLINEKQE